MRNFLVHGETWEGAFKGKPRQPYRVGLVNKNLEYLDEFERAEHGPNVFDVQQVRDATRRCARFTGILQRCAMRLPRPQCRLKKKSRRLRDQVHYA
jgi:hypothetical protein